MERLSSQVHMLSKMHDYSSSQIAGLKQIIERNKRYLAMVIHDMRNPTVSLKVVLTEALDKLQTLNMGWHLQEEFDA